MNSVYLHFPDWTIPTHGLTAAVQDCVRVDIGDEAVISKRLEDIRLMESRKSARLVNSDTDFSLLADFNIVEQVR